MTDNATNTTTECLFPRSKELRQSECEKEKVIMKDQAPISISEH